MKPDDEVYEAIARGLAAMREPDLSAFPAEVIDIAMARAFTFYGPRPDWLAALRRHIEALSSGFVHLEDADRAAFPALVKDPAASYQRLTGVFSQRLVVLGPFNPPVQFMS